MAGILPGNPLCQEYRSMRKFVVPVLSLLVVGACADAPTAVAPELASFELVDETQKRTSNANISLFATFTLEISGGPAIREAGPGINSEGKEIGACHAGGRWLNPSNKKYAAAVPHSHCMTVAAARTISLEPITAAHWTQLHAGGARSSLKVALDEAENLLVEWNGASAVTSNHQMEAKGVVHAHAVDQHGVRHGTFTFDLAQYAAPGGTNLFGEYEAETEGGGDTVFGLSQVIQATYTAPDLSTQLVPGTIYWTETTP
jgi:hypothetical protein